MERVTADKPEYQADRSEQAIEYQRQDQLRDGPADRERQYHPSHENRPNEPRPGEAHRADGQSQGRQGNRQSGVAANEPFPGSQSAETDQPQTGELPKSLGWRTELDVRPLHWKPLRVEPDPASSIHIHIRFQSSWNCA